MCVKFINHELWSMVYVNGSHIVRYGLCGHVYVYFTGLCEWFMVHVYF
jgi:hypothetical protein